MKISIAFHLVGMIMWLGALLVTTRFMRVFAAGEAMPDTLRAILKRTWFGFGIGGAVVAVASGLSQLFLGGVSVYMAQGWFHGKLTFVIVLLVVTALVHVTVLGVAAGGSVTKKRAGILHGLTGLSLIVIVFLTILGRGSGL